MSMSDEGRHFPEGHSENFMRKALEEVERAYKLQRLKQIVIVVLAFSAAIWLAWRPTGPELQIECTLVIVLGLTMGVCTSKIMSLSNRKTRAILRAIAESRGERF